MHLNKRCKNIYTKSQFNALQIFIFAAFKSQGQPEISQKKTAMMRRRVVRIQADCFGLIDDTKLQCSCQPSLSLPYFRQTLSPHYRRKFLASSATFCKHDTEKALSCYLSTESGGLLYWPNLYVKEYSLFLVNVKD